MINIITELSKYLIVILMTLFTLQCFTVFKKSDEEDRKYALRKQIVTLLFLDTVAYLVMYLQTLDFNILIMYLQVAAYTIVIQVIYRIVYRKASIILVNDMCLLLSCGFIILTRLNFEMAEKQFAIVVIGTVLSLLVPVIIRKVKLLKDLTWLYGIFGILCLAAVWILAPKTGGANLSLEFGGVTFQLSEVVKITFLFFMAGILRRDTSFRNVVITTAVAGAHVLILVLSRDLGSALVFFVTYVVMVYVATRKPLYALAGLGGGAAASVLAYYLFGHVRQRVVAWRDPFSVYETNGYQIVQSLFAICAGGWFGTGLFKGSPDTIPVVTQDSIFAAICEELGGIFAICMLLVCMSCFLMIVNISMKMGNKFYKLIALGLGTEYAFQVFLTVGGTTKFIPLTGITLPLVSYGGSSVICTIIMLAIIQGLYILREDEGVQLEKQRQERIQRQEWPSRQQSGTKSAREKSLEEKIEEETEKASGGREYVVVSYAFVAIFLALIGYIVYFNTQLSEEFQNSPYNKRQNAYEEQVVEGDITAAGGEVLAETQTDGEGNEYRVYPYSNLFSHVVGYNTKGRSGLESTENYHLLTSHAGAIEQVQKELRDEKNMGDTVVTTLDLELQQTAYDALGGYNGAVVVMEPDTGKILAMVSKPDFDPNSLDEIWDTLVSDESNTNLLNRATQGLYPPGSTFKIVTTLAYLRSGENINDFHFDCQGEVTNGGYTIHCYNNNVHGPEDFATAFAKSCNSAFAQLGVDLNRTEFRNTAQDVLFNRDLPLDLPYSRSSFDLDKDTADALAMQTAIGQGDTLASPFHMALITCAVANGGNLMEPYLVDRIENYNGEQVKKYTPSVSSQLMTSDEAALISELMKGVVENGTASMLSGRGYTAAGKTGTAEHGDMTESPHAWFVGFSNVDNPDIVVSVIAESAGTGSDVAVPIASQIFDAYYN